MSDGLESQLAAHIKPGDLIQLWDWVENQGRYMQGLFLCYSVTKTKYEEIHVEVLGWTYARVVLNWNEGVHLITMPSR